MTELAGKKLGTTTTIHGDGDIGGKAEGLVLLDEMELTGAQKLRTEIFTTEIFDRYRNNSDQLDAGCLARLREVHASFERNPIGVRSSERLENDPDTPTSGQSTSHMLPNIHPDPEVRFRQFQAAITSIFDKFIARYALRGQSSENLAFLVNPVPGVTTRTNAGSYFYPLSSGVADSFFKHPLNLEDGLQDPRGGFARVAFGHGYAAVRDDFEVIPVATIRKPIRPALMSKNGQQFFYAINLDENPDTVTEEMATMSVLNMRFADPRYIGLFSDDARKVNFDRLVTEDLHGYRSELAALMEQIEQRGGSFQIEFTWNMIDGKGVFHVVQYKKLREVDLSDIRLPKLNDTAFVTTDQFQGHGVISGIRYAVVINPFEYRQELHDEVVRELRRLNTELRGRGERYVLVCPGRLGTTNRKWGFNVEYDCVSGAAAIVEYGFDSKGSASIEVEEDELTGGVYGSHFLYQILGGADEAERGRRARMFGSQGTHFLTNLYTSGTLYLFVDPNRNHLDRWFFSPRKGQETAPIYRKSFPRPVTAYANLFDGKCLVFARPPHHLRVGTSIDPGRPARRLRIINPQKLTKVYVFAASSYIRDAAPQLDTRLPNCRVVTISNPKALTRKLSNKAFVLFVDEGAMSFLDREAFKKSNPFGTVVLLSSDLRVGCAPTSEEVERVCPMAKKADLVFYIDGHDCRPSNVMPAAVRCAEDRHNIEYHKSARRFIFLVVDDELRWFSQFLPVLYRIIGQRADVLVARTYEEARQAMDQHGPDIVCLITDILFPKEGVLTSMAGRELIAATRRERPRIPIIIASKGQEGRELQDIALILPKGEAGAVETLYQYVHDFTGMGDFLFYQGKKLWRRASTLTQLRDAVADAPIAILEEYASKDYFSTWLYMHGFRRLAERLVPRHDTGDELRRVLLSSFDNELTAVREQELVLTDDDHRTTRKASTIEELAQMIDEIDIETLRTNTSDDIISMWLMRKGYPELADRIRPIHGEGEELRQELQQVFREWFGRRP